MTDPHDRPHSRVAVLGAGISGLSASYHLGHRDTVVYEGTNHYAGHVHCEVVDGFTWDDGPHFSFASNKYVKQLLEDMVDGEFETLSTKSANYFYGSWIDHPAQANLYQVPEPLRTQCVESFLASRNDADQPPKTYWDWLCGAMGPVFAANFPAAYTRKYWTTEPSNLSTEWVGNRILKPDVEEVLSGAQGLSGRTTSHYIAKSDARYPTHGGFMGYTHKMAAGADIRYGHWVEQVDLERRILTFADGTEATYDHLISTIPLKQLVLRASGAPDTVHEAAATLRCTEFLRVDVAVDHPSRREDTWLYCYDEDKLSTRISFTEKFSPNNAPPGTTGIQVETYGSEYRALPSDYDVVKERILNELEEMALIDGRHAVRYINVTRVPQGNPIFDLDRRAAMDEIDPYLDGLGVQRVGRYGEWKYLMTDACIISSLRAVAAVNDESLGVDAEGITLSEVG